MLEPFPSGIRRGEEGLWLPRKTIGGSWKSANAFLRCTALELAKSTRTAMQMGTRNFEKLRLALC